MRNIVKILSFMAIAVSLAACEKETETSYTESEVHELSVTMDAGTFQQPGGDTKAVMEAVVRANWAEGDKVSVINVTTGKLLGGQLSAAESGTSVAFIGTVSGALSENNKLVYVYPAIKNNTEEEDFGTVNLDLSSQTYNPSANNVVFYGYSDEDTYSSTEINKTINFNLVTSYVHLNMSSLPTSTAITTLTVSNINDGFSWTIENNHLVAESYMEKGGITVTCTDVTSTSTSGNAIVHFAVPESDTADERILAVNNTKTTAYTTAAREAGSYYNQLYANWADAELSISKTGTTTVCMAMTQFRDSVNAGNTYSGYTVTVLKDIDLTDDTWVPIGTSNWNKYFCGIFDGDNHKISLTKTQIDGDYGLFLYIWGESNENPVIIRNLNLEINLSAKEGSSTWIGGVTDLVSDYARFENVTVTGSLTTGKYGSGFIGWSVYEEANCVFENCTNKANITAKIPSSADWSIIGGISSQVDGASVSFINCRNEGKLTADHTNNTSAASYIGHMAGKGNYDDPNDLIMTTCSYADTATITGWNVTEGDASTFPFEGSISGKSYKTYFETPNPGKLMIGGYFTSCNLNGVSTTFIYPNGIAHIQMTAAAYLSEDVASRGFYYSESDVYYKSKYDKKQIGKAYSEQFKSGEYICYVPLDEMATVIGTFGDGFNSSLTWVSGTPIAADWATYKTELLNYDFSTASTAIWSASGSGKVSVTGEKSSDSLGKITITTDTNG